MSKPILLNMTLMTQSKGDVTFLPNLKTLARRKKAALSLVVKKSQCNVKIETKYDVFIAVWITTTD